MEDLDDLDGTGYTELDYLDAVARLEEADDEDEDDEGGGYPAAGPSAPVTNGLGNPVVSSVLVWDDAAQQDRWNRFTRSLRTDYPDHPTIAARIIAFLEDHDA